MQQQYIDGKKVYSVPMMHMYFNTIGKNDPIYKIKIDKYFAKEDHFGYDMRFSLNDIMKNKKMYKEDYDKIKKADLRYPILINESADSILDGRHRIAKALISGHDTIEAYKVKKSLLKKFLISSNLDFKKVDKLTTQDIIELFKERFNK